MGHGVIKRAKVCLNGPNGPRWAKVCLNDLEL